MTVVLAFLLLQVQTPWEELSARLLKGHPRDPLVLMLCLDRKDLDGHRKLATLDRSPMTLSLVVNALAEKESEPAVRAELLPLLTEWSEKDPGNGYPPLLLGCLKAAGGDLPGAIALLEAASRARNFRSYAVESRTAVTGMLRERRITDLMAHWQCSGLQRLQFEMNLLSAFKILHYSGEEEAYRGRDDEAERLFTIQLEIGRRLLEDKANDSYAAAPLLLRSAADNLYSIALARRKPEPAAKVAEFSRVAFRHTVSMRRAVQAMQETPIGKFCTDFQMERLELLPDLIAGKPEARKEVLRREEAFLGRNEKPARTMIETGLSLGECQRVLQYLPEKEQKTIATMKTPIDALVEAKDTFYPERYTPEHRARLVALATAPFTGEDTEPRDVLAIAATQALLFHRDREAAAAMKDEVYLKASLGDDSPAVVKALSKDIEEGIFTMYYRALARLGRKEVTGPLLKAMQEAMRTQDYTVAVPAAYALRDLTGKDFGIDVARWEAFAREQPALFGK